LVKEKKEEQSGVNEKKRGRDVKKKGGGRGYS